MLGGFHSISLLDDSIGLCRLAISSLEWIGKGHLAAAFSGKVGLSNNTAILDKFIDVVGILQLGGGVANAFGGTHDRRDSEEQTKRSGSDRRKWEEGMKDDLPSTGQIL